MLLQARAVTYELTAAPIRRKIPPWRRVLSFDTTSIAIVIRFAIIGVLGLKCLTVTAVVAIVIETRGSANDAVDTEVFRFQLSIPQEVQRHNFQLKSLRAGHDRRVLMTLSHKLQSSEAIHYESVATSGTVVVNESPKEPLLQGLYSKFDVLLKANPHPTSHREQYALVLHTTGAIKRFDTFFVGVYEDYVGFAQHDFTHRFGKNQTQVQFEIPLFVTDDLAGEGALPKLTFKTSEELSFLKLELVRKSNRYSVVGSLNPSAVGFADSVAGEIQLLRDNQVVDEVVCFLEPQSALEILPSKLILVPLPPTEEAKFEGTVLIRLRVDETSQSKSVRNIVCKDPSGTPLEVTWEPVGKEFFRVEIRVHDEASLQGSRGRVRFHVETASGDRYEVGSLFAYSNG